PQPHNQQHERQYQVKHGGEEGGFLHRLFSSLASPVLYWANKRRTRADELSDLQEQLALLRRRMARVDRKYASAPPGPSSRAGDDLRPARYFVEEWLSGEEIETPFG